MKQNLPTYYLSIFFLAYLTTPLLATGKLLKNIPHEVAALFSPSTNILGSLAHFFQETKKGDSIKIATTYFTNPLIAHGLAQASSRGVDVTVLIDQQSCTNPRTCHNTENILSLLSAKNVTTHVYNENQAIKNQLNQPHQMHLKTAIWRQTTQDQTQYRIASGSSNYSVAAQHNREHIVFHPNNKQLFKQYEALITNLAIQKNNSLSWHTQCLQQQEPCMFISNQYLLTHIISALIMDADCNSKVRASSFLFNNMLLAQAIIEAKKRKNLEVELIVDQATLKNIQSEEQLHLLNDNGIKVYIFSSPRSKPAINHAKYLLLKNNNEFKVLEGSASFTDGGNADINQLTFHKNNKVLFRAFRNRHAETREKSHLLSRHTITE